MNNKIAIIEDDPFTQYLYAQMMKRAGFEAFIFEDAELLINKLNADHIALIIMDINLRNTYLNSKKINGIELSKHIKSRKEFATIPIILVSAFSLISEKQSILKESMAHLYITKPITDFRAFVNTVKEIIASGIKTQNINS